MAPRGRCAAAAAAIVVAAAAMAAVAAAQTVVNPNAGGGAVGAFDPDTPALVSGAGNCRQFLSCGRPGRSSRCRFVRARIYTDPHISTFDRVRYDCMGSGEFTMLRLPGGRLEAQARFSGPTTSGSVTTGLAVRAAGATVQYSIADPAGEASAHPLGECLARLYINGAEQPRVVFDTPQQVGTGCGITYFATAAGAVRIEVIGLATFTFRVATSSYFGCYIESLDTVLAPWTASAGVRGLLGTSNGAAGDDWTTPAGTVIPLAAADPAASYAYCTSAWCVQSEAASLFSYDAGTSFSSIRRCDAPYVPVSLRSAPAALTAACAGNRDCLVDGIVTGNETFALNTVAVQRQLGLPPPPPFNEDASNTGNPTDVASLVKTTLVVTYSWPTTQRDLDTATTFLGGTVGYGCGSANASLLSFSSDNTGAGGTEVATARIGRALVDGVLPATTVVAFAAGWHRPPNRGPATLLVTLLGDGGGAPLASFFRTITPGVQRRCAGTRVGSLTITTTRGGGARLRFVDPQ